MKKITNKMPITIILLFFSYLIAFCGIGSGVFWVFSQGRDISSFIYGLMILTGSLLLASLIRMFADIGQMIFDTRGDLQDSFSQAREFNQDLRNQLQSIVQRVDQASLEAQELDKRLSQDLRNQLQLQADLLKQNFQSIAQDFAAIKNNFDQMNCDSRDMNQNIHQIRDFFEQIERHLDLKK